MEPGKRVRCRLTMRTGKILKKEMGVSGKTIYSVQWDDKAFQTGMVPSMLELLSDVVRRGATPPDEAAK